MWNFCLLWFHWCKEKQGIFHVLNLLSFAKNSYQGSVKNYYLKFPFNVKVLQPDMREPLSGKKRRKPRVRNLIEDVCLLCDGDKEAGALILCRNKQCASKYHLPCLGLTSTPKGENYLILQSFPES